MYLYVCVCIYIICMSLYLYELIWDIAKVVMVTYVLEKFKISKEKGYSDTKGNCEPVEKEETKRGWHVWPCKIKFESAYNTCLKTH